MKHNINTRVKVIKPTDGTMVVDAIGKEGRVYAYNTNGATGNTEEDPLHYVVFDDNTNNTFWYEELSQV